MKLTIAFVILFTIPFAAAQVPEHIQRYRNDASGSIANRKKGVMDGNRVRTVFQNNGEVSDWYDGAVSAPHLEWPKGTGHRHLEGFTFMTGAKVKITTSLGASKYITPIETGYREEMDVDPVTRDIWGFEPIAGYANPSGTTPAMSNNKNTYPAVWPAALGLSADWNGEWYGYFGKGQREGVLETYYVMDDSRDKEFQNATDRFYPIVSDSLRGGLGLRVEVRGLQFQHQLLEDILFWNYTVTNISDLNYDSTVFGMFFDPSVGSVSNDARVNINANMVYTWAPGGKGLPNNYTTGYLGIGVLHSPQSSNGKTIASTYLNLLGNKGPASVWPKNDNVMWGVLTGGFADTVLANANISVVVGSPVFSFPHGTTEQYNIAMILGDDLSSALLKKKNAQLMFDNKFVMAESLAAVGKIHIKSPESQNTVSGTVDLNWDISGYHGMVTSHIFISAGGNNWKYVGTDTSGTNSFSWNSTAFPDGIFYKVAVMSVLEDIHNYLYSERTFIVNNSGNAKPEIIIVDPAPQMKISEKFSIRWIGGDADGDSCSINLYYRLKNESHWGNITTNISASARAFQWDTKTVPNSAANDYELKAEIISTTDTASIVAAGFSIVNAGLVKQGDPFILSRKAQGTGKLNISVVDPSSITGHSYVITFVRKDPQTMTANVTDLNSGMIKLAGAQPLDGDHETRTFDGIRLNLGNEKNVAIDNGTGLFPGFNTNASFAAAIDRFSPAYNIAWPADYSVQFSSVKKDAPLFADPPMFINDSVNFTITNITAGYRCNFLLHDADLNGVFNAGDTIRIIDGFVNNTEFKLCYAFTYSYAKDVLTPIQPSAGDNFIIKTKRPFIPGDSIIFTSKGLTNVRRLNEALPSLFSLSQNFPNPFNPVTTIRFSIPSENIVELKIYDVIGKLAAVVVREKLSAGEYAANFDGSKLSSGTYFMRLIVNNQVLTKKLMLLK